MGAKKTVRKKATTIAANDPELKRALKNVGGSKSPHWKIGAKVVSHGRYVAFQMAEVAIPRSLFADILRLIVELRPLPITSIA